MRLLHLAQDFSYDKKMKPKGDMSHIFMLFYQFINSNGNQSLVRNPTKIVLI